MAPQSKVIRPDVFGGAPIMGREPRTPTTSKKASEPSSEDLLQAATISYDGVDTNRERLQITLKMLLGLIPVAEGLVRSKPSQGHVYSLTNLVSQANDVMAQLEATTDYETLADDIYRRQISPLIEDIVKELGRLVKQARDELLLVTEPKNRKRVGQTFDKMFRKFGQACEERLGTLQEGFSDYIISRL